MTTKSDQRPTSPGGANVLRESEALLELFFSQSLDGFFFMMLDEPVRWEEARDKDRILDYAFAHQRITKVNDAMLAQYGATREQFLGLTPNDFYQHDLAHGREVWRRSTSRRSTLIVWGDKDAYFLRDQQDALAARIANAKLVIYSGAGHALHWEEPQRFANDLKAFVEKALR